MTNYECMYVYHNPGLWAAYTSHRETPVIITQKQKIQMKALL